jgi:dTDP-4-dehydrorhamnose reductase
MRILLTGRKGQVGFELTRSLSVLGEVTAVDRDTCDLTNDSAARSVVRDCRPDVIVNAAAYTMVDRAEADAQIALQVNAIAPAVLAEEADAIGALLVHYSTDYVFDGTNAKAYTEADVPNPINVYGTTKWQGEKAIAAATRRHLILRTSWVLGAHGANFAKTMLRLATERTALSVVADQYGTPTSAALIADATAHLVRHYLVDGHKRDAFPFGIYHLVASGDTNWCDYSRFVISEAQKLGQVFKTVPEAIRAITTSEYPTPAKRPANSRMSNRKFSETFGLRLPPWQDGVEHVLKQIF